ncbi:hypothetical protein IMZ48_46535 [Candidatus Bathyarchaeota archaeon]|nr:hypothetical protein [Candidatus Bathyarchaeota archaeon]
MASLRWRTGDEETADRPTRATRPSGDGNSGAKTPERSLSRRRRSVEASTAMPILYRTV